MSDLEFQNFSTVQSKAQPHPTTMAAAAAVAPTGFMTFVTGTTNMATITPPVTGQHMLAFVASGSAINVVTTGNITVGTTTMAAGGVLLLFYDPRTEKYHAK